MSDPTPRLLLHGGPSMRPNPDEAEKALALERARAAGEAPLVSGGAALDAVTEAVASLEASGRFLAGAGATPQWDGVVRCDASIMSGGRAGAVQSVSGLDSAIRAARAVCDRLGHTSLVDNLRSISDRTPGMFVTGNYLNGPSVAACVVEAERTANEVTASLDETRGLPARDTPQGNGRQQAVTG